MAQFAVAAKPAMWIACAGIALGAIGWAAWRIAHRGDPVEELLPRIDIAAYNDAIPLR